MIKTTANKIIIRRDFINEPSDNNSLFATIRTNGIAMRNTINDGRKSRSKIEIIHNQKITLQNEPKRAALFRASISHPRYQRLRKQLLATLLTARELYNNKKATGERNPLRLNELKNSSTKRAGHYSSTLSLLLSTCFHRELDQY